MGRVDGRNLRTARPQGCAETGVLLDADGVQQSSRSGAAIAHALNSGRIQTGPQVQTLRQHSGTAELRAANSRILTTEEASAWRESIAQAKTDGTFFFVCRTTARWRRNPIQTAFPVRTR